MRQEQKVDHAVDQMEDGEHIPRPGFAAPQKNQHDDGKDRDEDVLEENAQHQRDHLGDDDRQHDAAAFGIPPVSGLLVCRPLAGFFRFGFGILAAEAELRLIRLALHQLVDGHAAFSRDASGHIQRRHGIAPLPCRVFVGGNVDRQCEILGGKPQRFALAE